jgi:hypothetical protein
MPKINTNRAASRERQRAKGRAKAQNIVTTTGDGGDRQTYWANRINGHLRKSVEEIVQAGLDLTEARDELAPQRKYTAMVEEQLQITLRTAEMLMKIASHPVLSDPNHGSVLPTSWRTLSELALLPPKIVEARIADHTINPEMQRKDVVKLKPGHAVAAQHMHKARMAPIDRLKEENEELQQVNADLEERLAGAEADAEEEHEGPLMWLLKYDVEVFVTTVIDVVGEDKARVIGAAFLRRCGDGPAR